MEQFSGDRRSAVEYALAKQTRRNMSQLERAAVLIELHASQLAPRGNHSKSPSAADFVTLAQLADRSGLSERTLRRARALHQNAIQPVRIVLSKGVITVEEAEKIAAKPPADQKWSLKHLLELKWLRRNPISYTEGVLDDGGRWIFLSDRDRRLGKIVHAQGVPELRDLIEAGKNIGLVAAAALAKLPAEQQRRILADAPWVRALRRLPLDRFCRRKLRKDPFYFAVG